LQGVGVQGARMLAPCIAGAALRVRASSALRGTASLELDAGPGSWCSPCWRGAARSRLSREGVG
jgi:hypothetical protein